MASWSSMTVSSVSNCVTVIQEQAGTCVFSSAPAHPFLSFSYLCFPDTPNSSLLQSRMTDTVLSESLPWDSFPSCFHSLFHPMTFWKASLGSFCGEVFHWLGSHTVLLLCWAFLQGDQFFFYPCSLYSYRSLSHPRGAACLAPYKLPSDCSVDCSLLCEHTPCSGDYSLTICQQLRIVL